MRGKLGDCSFPIPEKSYCRFLKLLTVSEFLHTHILMNVDKTGDQTVTAHCTRPTPYHTCGGSSATFPSFKSGVQELLLQHTQNCMVLVMLRLRTLWFESWSPHGLYDNLITIQCSGMKVFPMRGVDIISNVHINIVLTDLAIKTGIFPLFEMCKSGNI